MKNISGIYGIRSISHPERVYIGSSTNTKQRWKQHQGLLGHKKHHSKKLQYHYTKYGLTDLVFELIIQCEAENLIKAEQIIIDIYKPWFNNCPTAGTTLGRRLSKKTKDKMSKVRYNKHFTEEHRKNISKGNQSKAVSKKAKENMSKAKLGKNNPMYNKLTHNCKLVINLETGVFYDSINKAAHSININPFTLYAYLSGRLKNKTMFALV